MPELHDLRAEIDSLAGEIIHAYEELHLLYELSEGLTSSLSVADISSLVLDKLLHALNAGSAELSLASGSTRVDNPAISSPAEHSLTTTLRSAGAVLGQLEVTRPLEADAFSSADGKV